MDGSTFVFTNRLIESKMSPSAMHIFNLSNLLESLIFHDKIYVLNTTEDSKELTYAIRKFPKGLIKVIEKTNSELIDEYVKHVISKYNASDPPRDIYYQVLNRFSFKELENYENFLNQIYKLSFTEPISKNIEPSQLLKSLMNIVSDSKLKKSIINIAKRELMGGRESFERYCYHYRRWDNSGGSPFYQWKGYFGGNYLTFSSSILSRAGIYDMVSQMYEIPYKADFLRWPLFWKEYIDNNKKQRALEEQIFKLAEEMEIERGKILHSFYNLNAIKIQIPFLLRGVLKLCKSKKDILKVALKLRNHNSAVRFRRECRKLNQNINNEEFESVIRTMNNASNSMSRHLQVSNNEILYSLLSIPSFDLRSLAFHGKLPAESLFNAGKQLFQWWEFRKFVFVSKIIKSSRKAKSLNTEIDRLFKMELNSKEIELLNLIDSL